VKLNGILECEFLPKTRHRTPHGLDHRGDEHELVARGCWLLEREEHRTPHGLDHRGDEHERNFRDHDLGTFPERPPACVYRESGR
jgi:hypothetical protein